MKSDGLIHLTLDPIHIFSWALSLVILGLLIVGIYCSTDPEHLDAQERRADRSMLYILLAVFSVFSYWLGYLR